MKNQELFTQIEMVISQKHMLNHPFYQAWSMGKLTNQELADYLKQYFFLERAFPRFMSSLHSRTQDSAHRQVMLQNLMDEEAGENNHVAQLLRLCEIGFGLSEKDLADVQPNEATRNLIAAFEEATQEQDIMNGLAAMVVYKQQVSDVAATKLDGLKTFYGIEDASALEFYLTHAHVNRSYHEILDQVADAASSANVLERVQAIRDAFWQFLDGVTTPQILARCNE